VLEFREAVAQSKGVIEFLCVCYKVTIRDRNDSAKDCDLVTNAQEVDTAHGLSDSHWQMRVRVSESGPLPDAFRCRRLDDTASGFRVLGRLQQSGGGHQIAGLRPSW